MRREFHVRFCEGGGVQFPSATRLVLGFQSERDAKAFLADLKDRLGKFGLSLHEDKTRLIQFGRYAAEQREKAGLKRPETFNFLGFTHYCAQTRSGKFTVKRKTQSQRLTRKLKELGLEMKKRLHAPVKEQHSWLCQVLRGHYGYYGVISNSRSMHVFYRCVTRRWHTSLRRRSQKSGLTWERFGRLLQVFPLPKPCIHQLWRAA